MPMPTLRELQSWFWAGIATPGAPPPPLLEAVAPGERLTPTDRIGVYAGMYRWRLIDALREDYPKLASALGPDAFADMVGDYVTAHPSRNPSLRHLGGGLADFLCGRDVPGYLADLARLEWARVEAFDAPDALPLSLADLRDVPAESWGALRFRLAPWVGRVYSAWRVHDLWDEPAVVPEHGPTVLRVWRQGFRVYHAAVADDEAAALDLVETGCSFADICTSGADDDPEAAAARAGSLLARWLEDGLLLALSGESQ